MADEEQEIRTQRVQQGDTAIEKQSISRNSVDDSVVKIERIIYLIYGVFAGILIIRFILSLLGANTSNTFADLIYSATGLLVAPFIGLFNTSTVYGVSRFDIESLIAIIVYGLIAWVIIKAFDLSKKNNTSL